MQKQILPSIKLQEILERKDPSFIINAEKETIISISNCEFGYFGVNKAIEIPYKVVFNDCSFMQPLYLTAKSNDDIVFNSNCYFDENLILSLNCKGLIIEGLKVRDFLLLQNCEVKYLLYRTVASNTILDGGKFDTAIFQNIKKEDLENKFEIRNVEFERLELRDFNCTSFKLHEKTIVSKFYIYKATILYLIAKDISLQTIHLNNSFVSSIDLNKNRISDLFINIDFKNISIKTDSDNKSTIDKLTIVYNPATDKSSTNIIYQKIATFLLFGIKSKDNSLILKDLELNNLEINDFSNEGTLRLHNVQFNKDSNVKIDNSFLGKTELNNVDFSQAKEFYISKSNVLDLITTNTKYPKNRDTYKGENEEDRRELFRQLKTISSKNKEQEQIFEGFELDIQESLTKKWNDKIALFLNRISNSHGQNWILALIFTLLSSLIFFILYVISLQNTFDFRLIFNSKGYQFLNTPILDYFKYYFEFLNPTHRFNFITDDINFASSFWDFLGRTFTGYGIYQLIAAFRKHGKKA